MATTKLTISIVSIEDQKQLKKLRSLWEAKSEERYSLAKVISTLVSDRLNQELSNV